MFFARTKNFLRISLAVICAVLFCFYIRLANLSKLSSIAGERTFFLLSPSSQGVMKSMLELQDVFRVKGESVSFYLNNKYSNDGGRYATNEELLKGFLAKFHAKIVFSEKVAGVISYYCYTPLWMDEVVLDGHRINLHIAFSSAQCSVGTPIIFGGF